jgi:hypothetical protein
MFIYLYSKKPKKQKNTGLKQSTTEISNINILGFFVLFCYLQYHINLITEL